MVFAGRRARRGGGELPRLAPAWLGRLFEETADVVACVAADLRILALNGTAAQTLGVDPRAQEVFLDDVIGGESWWPSVEAALRAGFEEGTQPPDVEVAIAVGRRTRWFQVRVVPVTVSADEPMRSLLVARDVTADRDAQRALQSSEARLAGILDLAHDAIISVDARGDVVLFNQGAARMFGFAPDEVLGRPLDLLMPQRFATTHHAHLAAFATHELDARPMGLRGEIVGRRKDGTEFPARASISRLDTPDGVVFTAIVHDLSEHRRTEEELHLNRTVLAAATAVTGVGTWERDLATGAARWSPEVFAILGLDPAATPPGLASFLAAVHPHDRPRVEHENRRATSEGHPYEVRFRVLHADGRARHVIARGQRLDRGSDHAGRLVGTLVDVTERVEAEQELRRSQESLARAQEIAHLGSWDWDIVGGGLSWSDEVYRIFGVTPQSFGATYDAFIGYVHPDDRDFVQASVDAALTQGRPYDIRHRIVLADGQVRVVNERGEVTFDEAGRPVRMLGTVQDVTEHQRHLDAIAASERFVRSVLDSMHAQSAVLDRHGNVVALNRAWRQAAAARGADEELGLGRNYLELASEARGPGAEGAAHAAAGIQAVLDGRRDRFEMDYECTHDAGEPGQWFTLSVEALRIPEGGAVVSHAEITDRKRAEAALEHQALHDPLTRLPNRSLLADRITHALHRLGRSRRWVGVLFLDLDRFKLVNDSLGHAAGDDLLVQVAERLHDAVRPADTIARFGGDEFVVLCEGLRHPGDAGKLAARMLEAFRYPFVIAGRELYVMPSIGVAVANGDGTDAESLVRNADTAMYSAKSQGGNRYTFFDDDLRRRAVARLDVEHALRRALERSELLLHYQPLFDVTSGAVVGVEALLRWPSDAGRVVPPDEFIPVAEETALIVPMGAWALHEACRQLAAWDESAPGRVTPSVAVNLSARQVAEPGLVAMVADVLRHTGVAPERLCLEITETAVMQDADAAIVVLESLKALGVRLALDDFGTGHASLGYLSRFPVDALKIDRSFVARLGSDRSATAIVASIMALAEGLGLEVVAEGVEEPEQLEFLRAAGCRLAQGYLLCRPIPPGDLATLLATDAATLSG
jgi:diguanylate cyclase (GGDEF)-like protein/PAS domain S-box-containing protein